MALFLSKIHFRIPKLFMSSTSKAAIEINQTQSVEMLLLVVERR